MFYNMIDGKFFIKWIMLCNDFLFMYRIKSSVIKSLKDEKQ